MNSDRINAKEEFLDKIGRVVKCAAITLSNSSDDDEVTFILKVGHTKEELNTFLESLNFEYNNGFGGQYLFGTVWCSDDKSWFTRGEYDGSEWWEKHTLPIIPEELQS
jgi:hypothetical protein